ncbi:hypothetical protein [Rhodopseudomonas sp. BR0M22]|nr:hypothetical protein [Rhodopseudomonas sp. BR0M22]
MSHLPGKAFTLPMPAEAIKTAPLRLALPICDQLVGTGGHWIMEGS